jgi:hypothetical protein
MDSMLIVAYRANVSIFVTISIGDLKFGGHFRTVQTCETVE